MKENKEIKDNNKAYEKIEKEENKFKKRANKDDNKNQINELNEKNEKIDYKNEKCNEIKGKGNYEEKDKIINNIIKEDNNKDEISVRDKEIDIKKSINYIEYSIDKLKQRKKYIEILFKDLCKNIIGNNEMNDLDINEVNSNEILKNKNSTDLIQII